MTPPSPATDSTIVQRYDAKTLEKKIRNKTELQKELSWPSEPKRPMLCLPAGMSDTLGGNLLEELLPGLLTLPVEIVILGKGSEKYGKLFTELSKEHKHRLAIIPDDKKYVHAMYAASDMALFLSPADNLEELAACLRYGVVPIMPPSKSVEPYDPIQESGCAFRYEEVSVWHCFASVVRALETYRFPFDWRTIQKHCMASQSVQ